MPVINTQHLDYIIINNVFKDNNKNVFFLCHGGLGDLFAHCGAIRFLSYFYNKISLFCPASSLNNLQILFADLNNIDYLTYARWYEKSNSNNSWPDVSNEWHNYINHHFPHLFNGNNNSFNWQQYVNNYADISSMNSEEAWNHWVNSGQREGRTYLNYEFESFDWEMYVNKYQDLSFITNKEGAWEHWINYGRFEGREYYKVISFESFGWEMYLNKYQDLSFITNKEGAWEHWINFGRFEGRDFFGLCDNSEEINLQKIESLKLINNDIFVSGFVFNNKIGNKITHPVLLHYCNINLRNNNFNEILYRLIKDFYQQINLDLTIYYNYFDVSIRQEAVDLYRNIQGYRIVFLHFISSCGPACIPDNEWRHIYGEQYLIINPDKNHYDPNTSRGKHDLANRYLNLLVLDYISIILHASDIYVCDSSFANLIYPLRKRGLLAADNLIIYDRYYPNSGPNVPVPINLSK